MTVGKQREKQVEQGFCDERFVKRTAALTNSEATAKER